MQRLGRYILVVCMVLLTGCEDTTFRSSVPYYPVNLRIDTRLAFFVHFKPTNIYSYTIVDNSGYHFNGQTLPRQAMGDAYGYAGVVVFVSSGGEYMAYDMCCPKCLRQNAPIEVDGLFATCPTCGEQYNLDVYGTPQTGISGEALRRYNTLYSGEIITIRN